MVSAPGIFPIMRQRGRIVLLENSETALLAQRLESGNWDRSGCHGYFEWRP